MISSRRFSLIIALLLCAGASIAQTDAELNALIEVVKGLRVQSQENYNRATASLSNDELWTPMNETGAVREGIECRPADKVPGFKLNRILSKVDDGRIYASSHGDMLNGEDARYHYSLYERAIKAGKTAEYHLKGRVGQQTFVIVPFMAYSQGITASLQVESEITEGIAKEDGTIEILYDGKNLSREDNVILRVANSSDCNQSFVIINYNSGKK